MNDKIEEYEKNYELLSQEKNELNINLSKDKNELQDKINELMEILNEIEKEMQNRKDVEVSTDEYLLNQKLNELFDKERKKIEDDNKKYEQLEQAKPYQCNICGENFSLDVNLKEHMLQHTKIKTEEELDKEKEKIKENEKEKKSDIDNINNASNLTEEKKGENIGETKE